MIIIITYHLEPETTIDKMGPEPIVANGAINNPCINGRKYMGCTEFFLKTKYKKRSCDPTSDSWVEDEYDLSGTDG